LAIAPLAKGATFRGLGDLPGGGFLSGANGVSADGCVVVGMGTSASGREAFRWDRRGGMVGLGDLAGGFYSGSSWAASADGSVIVGMSSSANGTEAFRWTAAGGMVGLGDLPGLQTFSVAYSVSADGNVVAGLGHGPNGQEAFRWSPTTGMQGLGDLSGGYFESGAAGVSADGSVIVGIGFSTAGYEAVRWSQEGIAGLGDLPGGAFFSGANSVSADGSVVVGRDESELPHQAFLWHAAEGMSGLGFLPGADISPRSEARDISAVGYRVVGSAGSATIPNTAMVWDPQSGMRAIADVLESDGVNLAGWRLTEATGISDNGRVVVGRGINPQGQEEAWIAVLPGLSPDPSIPGDANLDGRVDGLDLALTVKHLGQTCGASFTQGDFTGDGMVSMADVLIIKNRFGTFSTSGAAAAVPETHAAALAALAGLFIASARWCRKARSRARAASPTETAATRAPVR
jgi:probable HAF family extracellular repeat protein